MNRSTTTSMVVDVFVSVLNASAMSGLQEVQGSFNTPQWNTGCCGNHWCATVLFKLDPGLCSEETVHTWVDDCHSHSGKNWTYCSLAHLSYDRGPLSTKLFDTLWEETLQVHTCRHTPGQCSQPTEILQHGWVCVCVCISGANCYFPCADDFHEKTIGGVGRHGDADRVSDEWQVKSLTVCFSCLLFSWDAADCVCVTNGKRTSSDYLTPRLKF